MGLSPESSSQPNAFKTKEKIKWPSTKTEGTKDEPKKTENTTERGRKDALK